MIASHDRAAIFFLACDFFFLAQKLNVYKN